MTEAVLLVGGQGTRLRPLTINTPKPMLPVAGVPCTEHQIARAREAGVTRIVLGTSYKAEVFRDYFGDGAKFGVELIYAVEDHPMGTGGAIRHVAEHLLSGPNDPVMVFNGDVLTGVDLRHLFAVHAETKAAVTLYLTRVADPRAFGLVPTDADGRVTAFLEKPKTEAEIVTDQINAGCYVFRRSVIDEHPHRPAGLGRARDLPEAAGRGRTAAGRRRRRLLAGPGHPAGLRAGLGGPRARHRARPRRSRGAPGSSS